MAVNSPSQYECDNAEKGDMIIVKYRNPIYKWYRKNFLKNKVIINVRKDWNSDIKIKQYQEDCVLIYSWELQSKVSYDNEVPYFLGYNDLFIKHTKNLKMMHIGLENVSITLSGGMSILIPTKYFRDGLNKIDSIIQSTNEQRLIREQLKFARYKGSFFEKRQKELGVNEWILTYCSVCGNPIKIEFNGNTPHISNTCTCNNMVIKEEDITWDMVAYWYNRQTSDIIKSQYKEFWKM